MIDYKGYRCLAIAKVPIRSNQGPSLGFFDGNYQFDSRKPELQEVFKRVGEELNLKASPITFIGNYSRLKKAPVSLFS